MTPVAIPGHPVGRALVALATLALVAGCGSSDTVGDGPASPSSSTPPPAVGSAATWLAGQLTDGLVHNDQYSVDDYGLTADVALALAETDEQPDVVGTIGDALAAHVGDYTKPGYGTLVSAGATAKLVLVAEAAGQDPTSYGGVDLVSQLEHTVTAQGPSAGRVADRLAAGNADAADYANVVAQSLAVEALDEADSPALADAVDFLVQQQCSDGSFRLGFTADASASDQSCDGDRSSAPDVDATAYAVLALEAIGDDSVSGHVDDAVAWLRSVQADDGSFSGTGPTGGPNANSTGVAGRALGGADEADAATAAATWLGQRQVGSDGGCAKLADDQGAVAYDDAALAVARRKGITTKTADQFRRATVGALPALEWAPAEGTSGPC